MLNYTNVLYDNQNVAGADPDGGTPGTAPQTSAWVGPWINVPARGDRTHSSIDCVASGTVGYNIEATNDIVKGDVTVVKSETASDSFVAESFVYFRVRVTSATAGATLRVTTDRQGCYLSTAGFSSGG